MVTIPQHGSNGELFDISAFLPDIDNFAKPDTWRITIEQCLGERAVEIERLSSSGYLLSDSAFRSLYHGIYQTIDGHFIGISGDRQLFELLAVDSSFWEVTGPQPFESHMLATYGAWQRA
ncbi:hypothetical protein FQY83_13875 [Luteimonas marina]|uniref:Uncharacterized protein n=1 Tax=Luteimonas marina TaxID=488485 RepID=A0A5C5U112_9GAMM|nr:hypothetical protein [Luteimonas marina]TWT19429.1 hypothetical protein FQY83_13875 [Luteimonas marina]